MALTKIDDRGLTTPIDLLDNEKIRFGTGNDLEIHHNGTDTYISHTGSGVFRIEGNGSNTIALRAKTGENSLTLNPDGAVELYYNNSKKFETKSYGANMPDDSQLYFGSDDDMVIKHDGSNGFITNGTGYLKIKNTNSYSYFDTNSIYLRSGDGSEDLAKFLHNGACELYYDNSKKLETTSTGAIITSGDGADTKVIGDFIFAKAGETTTRVMWDGSSGSAGKLEFSDNVVAEFGDGGDMQIYHDGTYNRFLGANYVFMNAAADEYIFEGYENGAVKLYYDNVNRFETNAYGVKVNGHIYADDSHKVQLGTSQDLEIYHNSSSYIVNNTSFLIMQSVNTIALQSSTGESMVSATPNGAVELYYDNDKRLSTWSDGVNIYGDEGEDAILHLYADDGDDNADKWRISSTHVGNMFTIETYASGSWLKVLSGHDNGECQLHNAGNQRLKTTTTGIHVNAAISIGAEAANNTLNVSGSAGSGQTTLYYGFGTVDLTSASDERVKDNVVPTAKGLNEILKLPIVDFTYTPEYSDDSTTVRTGGIAQEWQKIDPNLVNDEDKDLLFINYKETIPLLIKAVQELSAEVEALKAK